MRGWYIFMWALIGAVVGQLFGSALAPQVPILDHAMALSLDPTNLNLGFVVLTVGIQFKLSIGGAIGLVFALWLAMRRG
jgi:hypothetical protein